MWSKRRILSVFPCSYFVTHKSRHDFLKHVTAVHAVLHPALPLQSSSKWMRKRRDPSSRAARASGQGDPRQQQSQHSAQYLAEKKRMGSQRRTSQHLRSLMQQLEEVC